MSTATAAASVTPASAERVLRLDTDGRWCPMAHGNRLDDSFQAVAPLRRATRVRKIVDDRLSPFATYVSPSRPAVVAFDVERESVKWMSPVKDLRGMPRRRTSGILMAKLTFADRRPTRCVFCANTAEFVAYSEDGERLWKRRTTDISRDAPLGIGMPISISFTDANELVAATTGGWIVKLDPASGIPIDAYQMNTEVAVDGRLFRGRFVTFKSPVVIGDTMYLLVEFKADRVRLLPRLFSPVHLIRIRLRQHGRPGHEHRIRPLEAPAGRLREAPDRIRLGLNRGRGSPPALLGRDGVLLFAHAQTLTSRGLRPVLTAVQDRGGALEPLWKCALDVPPADSLHSAPALHAASRTLFVTTYRRLFVFRDVDRLSGDIRSPEALGAEQLLPTVPPPSHRRVEVGSPFALTYDDARDEIVTFTNVRLLPVAGYRTYGMLSAFAVPARGQPRARPLWTQPLGLTDRGEPASGPGTFGQPALFRYRSDGGEATGVIVNTVCNGTYIIK
jgi:hypothetical protein